MMVPARVDVLLPVYNGAAFLRSAVDSLCNQTLRDIRIHAVDDGSTDATPEILAEMAVSDPRIRVHRQPNGGIVVALNRGLRTCSAEYVARHDADDLAYPQRLQEQVDFLDAHPEVVAVGGTALHVDVHGARLGTRSSFPAPDTADPLSVPAREPYLLHPFLMVRRDALMRAGGYRHVVHAEDADLYWRLQELGGLYNDPAVQGEYRFHPDSISSKSVSNGRVMAVSSQLCALSAHRRRSGLTDLDFTVTDALALKQASGSLEAACEVASRQLTEAEGAHLRLAASGKLLETATYRPYQIELDDCRFMRRAVSEHGALLRPEDRSRMVRRFAGTAAKLCAAGRWREARVLLSREQFGFFVTRLLGRLLLPAPIHHRLSTLYRGLLEVARRRSG